MSAQVRAEIAAAANTVSGINCSPYFRQSVKPGDGMVRRERTNYPNPFGGIVTWQVIVALPQDLAAAEKYLDEHLPDLVEAIQESLVVTSTTPQQLALDTGAVPVVVIEGHREEDN
ncbi:hypothetical protein [Nocardioides antri]|uniref:DUF3168 domain-containing protein n=1 Tax=Nocardioides antri TaxID=2607659 RepID=A0A5B1LV78_9ACTN|nr:hypothetical protein [Nocardioides antri]KAA1424314.1 hypothetical protein F0U47_18955 [Nocardioides antri]